MKNGQVAGRKSVKSTAGKAAGKIIGTKAVAGVVGAAVIGGGAVAGYHIHQAKEQKVTKEEWKAAYLLMFLTLVSYKRENIIYRKDVKEI